MKMPSAYSAQKGRDFQWGMMDPLYFRVSSERQTIGCGRVLARYHRLGAGVGAGVLGHLEQVLELVLVRRVCRMFQ